MYSALIIMMWGIALYNGDGVNYIGATLVTLVVATKAHREERLMPIRFPGYVTYQVRTKRFIPFVL